VPSTVVLLGKWNWWPSKLRIDQPESPEPDAIAGGAPAPQPELR